MIQVKCVHCKSRFYFDNTIENNENPTGWELVDGKHLCSYCVDDFQNCSICGYKEVMERLKNGKIKNICKKCQETAYMFSTIFLFQRFEVLKRDNFSCTYCGRSPIKDKNVVLNIDHVEPKSKGGENTIENYTTSCFECNVGKSDKLLEKHQQELIRRKNDKGKQYYPKN